MYSCKIRRLVLTVTTFRKIRLIHFTFPGAGIHVFNGVPTGSLPNNGLVSLHPSHQTFSLRLFCRSDSMMESVGLFIGLDGIPVATHNSTFFEISNLQPGEVSVVNFEANSTNLNASGQGVYSCCIPLRSGEIMEINVGIYPSGFMGKYLLLYNNNKEIQNKK